MGPLRGPGFIRFKRFCPLSAGGFKRLRWRLRRNFIAAGGGLYDGTNGSNLHNSPLNQPALWAEP